MLTMFSEYCLQENKNPLDILQISKQRYANLKTEGKLPSRHLMMMRIELGLDLKCDERMICAKMFQKLFPKEVN
jgi:hypothetical protein